MRRMRRRSGFTLTELMVAIGIGALLTAITIPVTTHMIAGNRGMSCAGRMQRIHHAIRMYTLDWGHVPPYHPNLSTDTLEGPGLLALQTTDYLKSDTNLHCPADRQNPRGSPNYGMSYCLRDPQATYQSGPYRDWNQFKYLACRGVSDPTAPHYRRQLVPLLPSGLPDYVSPWQPDDTTIICWCDLHFMQLREGNQGQYQVLLWDGSVRRMDGALFRDGTPDAAWKVTPDDDDTPT